jgi:ABC-type phosphate transport system substrate-binding protein
MQSVARAIVLSLVVGAGPALAQVAPFKVVVHRSNELSSLQVEAVSAYFMRKKTTWPGGLPVKPVDLDKDSRVRATFSKAVLNKQVSTVRSFWQRQVFLGSMVPPPEAPSDAWVLAYIAQNPGAIGYVAADTPTGPAIKVLDVVKVFAAR